jgi:hypothetical protein
MLWLLLVIRSALTIMAMVDAISDLYCTHHIAHISFTLFWVGTVTWNMVGCDHHGNGSYRPWLYSPLWPIVPFLYSRQGLTATVSWNVIFYFQVAGSRPGGCTKHCSKPLRHCSLDKGAPALGFSRSIDCEFSRSFTNSELRCWTRRTFNTSLSFFEILFPFTWSTRNDWYNQNQAY